MDKIEIQLNRTRLCLVLFGSICFVALSLGLIFYADILVPKTVLIPKKVLLPLIICAGILGGLTFGIFSLIGAKTLLTTSNGLIIDKQGITLNSFNLIQWHDITNISVETISKNKIIFITVAQPEKYINRFGFFKRCLAKISQHFYKAPLSISPKSFKYNEDELIQLLQNKLNLYGKS